MCMMHNIGITEIDKIIDSTANYINHQQLMSKRTIKHTHKQQRRMHTPDRLTLYRKNILDYVVSANKRTYHVLI